MKCEEKHKTFPRPLVCDFSESFNYNLEMRDHSIGRDLVSGGRGFKCTLYMYLGGGV